ncbi:hypothetical protein LIER_16323 [Lithospermum erythrorhizon]|uniref:FLZ-type domain-containing protein n=1 Tax=Lithospermum erythrorhizon TaxID=34254 RepID=A0AAV3Q838_LITER
MSSRTNARRMHCFIEEDVGLASIAATEPGFSGNNNNYLKTRNVYYNGFSRGCSSLRSISALHTVSSPRKINSGKFFIEEHNHLQQPHFLDSCFLCNKPLGARDIFMYRGDTPFCSEECRQEQIEMDEAKERNLKSMKTLRNKEQRTASSTSQNKSEGNYRFRTSFVAAA